MCKRCDDLGYISIERGSGYVSHPCPDCKPIAYKKWLKRQTQSPLTIQGDGGDAVAISLLATAEALVALHDAKFEMSVLGLIGDSIKIAEGKLKVTLPDWARPLVEKLMRTP